MDQQQAEQELRECVKRGTELIDQHGPQDWRNKINSGELDMVSSQRCVLGQLYGSLGQGLEALKFKIEGAYIGDSVWSSVCHHGFSIEDERHLVPELSFPVLTRLWREEIGGANVRVPSVDDPSL